MAILIVTMEKKDGAETGTRTMALDFTQDIWNRVVEMVETEKSRQWQRSQEYKPKGVMPNGVPERSETLSSLPSETPGDHDVPPVVQSEHDETGVERSAGGE